MTPEEIGALAEVYTWLVEDLIEVCMALVFYGIFCVLLVITTNIFLHGGHPGGRLLRWVVLGNNTISFIFSTLNFTGQLLWFTLDIRSVFLDYIDLPLEQALDLAHQRLETAYMMTHLVSYLTQIHTDSIIVWRAWVLFPGQRWLMAGPIVLLVTFIVTAIISLALQFGSTPLAIVVQNSDFYVIQHLIPVRYVLSMATNVSATLLIAYKFWTHRKVVKHVQKQSRALNILFLMVESGVLYALLQITFVVMLFCPTSVYALGLSIEVFGAVIYALLPMYPTIVIALVYTQRSMVDTYSLGPISTVENIPSHDEPPKQGVCDS